VSSPKLLAIEWLGARMQRSLNMAQRGQGSSRLCPAELLVRFQSGFFHAFASAHVSIADPDSGPASSLKQPEQRVEFPELPASSPVIETYPKKKTSSRSSQTRKKPTLIRNLNGPGAPKGELHVGAY
jgi:hypothetical protein